MHKKQTNQYLLAECLQYQVCQRRHVKYTQESHLTQKYTLHVMQQQVSIPVFSQVRV